MRRVVTGLALVVALLAFGSGSAAAGQQKLVEGTVYDTTCVTACLPECPPPPHCGPITMQAKNRIVCPMGERMIACPLSRASVIVCVRAEGCPGTSRPPVWSGEGAVVTVRKRGSAKVLAKLPVTEGHFSAPFGAGEYVLRPYLPEPRCWSGQPARITVDLGTRGPVSAALDVRNRCVSEVNSPG